jgi:myo-inositol-1(or 4)-monophosphatase
MDLVATTTKVCDIAKEAGEIAKKYFRRSDLASHSKGGSDFVTQADLEVDEFLRNRLSQEFPNTQFLTEETAPEDYGSLKNAEDLWIIDPIDGTTNYSRGDSHFAISIALVDKGDVVLGVVYLPLAECMFYANRNEQNAFCNNNQIMVSKFSDLKSASVGYDWAWNLEDRKIMHEWVGKFMLSIRQPRALGSAAADIVAVGKGDMEGYINKGIKPWDIAAASLIIEKAGGKVTKHDGSGWNVFDDEIFVSNGKIHDELLSLLRS